VVILAAAETYSGVTQVLLAALGVVQTVALAIIADRSRRVRREDRRGRRPEL
jgi:DNA topoisomerase IA